MKKKMLILIAAFFLVFALAACNNSEVTSDEQAEKDNQLVVYTTIYPLQFFTEEIGGEFVATKNIVPPGSDAHNVEVTTKTMMELAESDAFIHTGTGLESFAESVTKAVEKEDVHIVNATEHVDFIGAKEDSHEDESEEDHEGHEDEFGESHDGHENESDESHEGHDEESEESHEEEGHADEHDHGHPSDQDPHVWLDPQRSITLAENIKNALVELDPEHKEQFENNFETLKGELGKLDSEFEEMANQAKIKTFLVSHSAYGYWEDAYGLEQIGISGLSPTDEPSQKDLTEIIEMVNEENLKYIYFEPNLTNKVAEAVKNETKTEVLTLNNLESITDENIKNDEDYLVIMRKNIEALSTGLN
ncbi:zinc ABC transporter substrate-binding protein [Cytobacillus oceanisediminis]|uniref:metal ABC transporter solute-binding protein, Zn/Mn family n=1 Tax=Cytobacillus oceanisediminis TaxID=665099 RepID=UPI0023DB9FA3|nr:zinc ABC transporter substrate-binding protein [Cytobacillus oceanisediminis]MDF2036458.1 zinc ABC transporter substrate-binding protein [Cytobacillus oceanisediminis]